MSRFSDYDDYEGEPGQILAMGRWQHNARVALKGKRGRQALRDLREALMALPEHKLIEGAVCTVGPGPRRAAYRAEAEQAQVRRREYYLREAARLRAEGRPDIAERFDGYAASPRELDLTGIEELDRHLERDGEGVCAVGAYVWYRKVKAGMDPAEAFASLPDAVAGGGDALEETARLGEAAGLTFTLAWELAYRNDEHFRRITPEERHAAFVAWIDTELAGQPAA